MRGHALQRMLKRRRLHTICSEESIRRLSTEDDLGLPRSECCAANHLHGTAHSTTIFGMKGFVMAWIALLLAGLLEIVWATAMKYSHGFTRLTPSVITLTAMVASFALLALAMRSLPLGTAYTIWTGIGAVGAFIVGIVALGEAVTPMRIGAAVLIVSGIVLMKLSSSH